MNTTMKMKAIPYEPSRQEGLLFEQVVTVRRIVLTTVALLIFSLMALGLSTASGAGTGSWYSSFESARAQAQRQNKPLVVMIARTGCSSCAEMEQNLATPTARRAWSNAVKVRVESSHNPALTARYAAGGTPTTIIFAPGNYSAPVYSYTGVMDRGTIVQVGRSISSF
jgi:thiol:disulfide interchange protein